MKYRVRMDLAFIDYDSLNDLLEEAERRFPQAEVISEDEMNEERGFIDVEKCYHDEGIVHPPCEKLDRWEVGRGKVFP